MAAEGVPPQAPEVGAHAAALPLEMAEESPRAGQGAPALRLAGGVLLLNAALVLMERVVLSGISGTPAGGAGANLVSIVIDAGLGVSLLTGNARYRGLATVRAALGMLVFTGLHLSREDMVAAALQVVLSSSLLMLLVGTPSGLRRRLALLGAVLCLLLEGVGIYTLRAVGGTQVVQGGVVTGRKLPFRMNVPGTSWLLRGEESAAKDNPHVDRWLIHSQTGCNLLLLGEALPAGGELNLDAFGKSVVENLRKGMNITEIQPSVCDSFDGMSTCLIRGSATIRMIPFEYEVRVFATPRAAYQFIAFGPAEDFRRHQDELRQAARSFKAE